MNPVSYAYVQQYPRKALSDLSQLSGRRQKPLGHAKPLLVVTPRKAIFHGPENHSLSTSVQVSLDTRRNAGISGDLLGQPIQLT